jgi:hypothetical protein
MHQRLHVPLILKAFLDPAEAVSVTVKALDDFDTSNTAFNAPYHCPEAIWKHLRALRHKKKFS